MTTAMRRLVPATAAALFFLGMAALYATGHRTPYEEILRAWGVDPFRFPFLDTETVLSAVRCVRAGVDVFAGNPCDPLRRVYDYSPLWLVLAKLPVTEAWTMPAALAVCVSFIASLTLLPPGRGALQTALITLGVISSAVVFTVERGNNDLVLFVLAVVAAALACRTPLLRVVGYGAALLAGLLKYYPMTLMALTTRERPGRFVAILAATLAVVALFLATMGDDLARALHLIPTGGWFGDMFGSSTLGGGLVKEFGWPASLAITLRVGLSIAALGAGVAIARRPAVTSALGRLTEAEGTALLAGGLLILGCFFTAQNIGYRVIYLVLTLPALTALWRVRAGPLWTATTFTVLALLWSQGWRNVIALLIEGRHAFIAGWLIREALWWWTIAMLIALVYGLLARSDIGARILRARASASSTLTAF